MKEENLEQILLFFFFTTLSEYRSKELARETWFWCLDKKKKNQELDSENIVLLALERAWKSLQAETRTGVASVSNDSGWRLPQGLSLDPWKEFQKTASSEELFITVMAQILKFKDERINEVLGLSPGTIRYRLAKTARKMGRFANVQSGVRR